MGLRQANIYTKGLAEALEMKESDLIELLAQYRVGGYARVWEIEDKGNYATCRVSTNRKDGDKFIPDFSDGFVSFVGSAYEKIKDVEIPENKNGKPVGVSIQITSVEATTRYIEKKNSTYHNYAVFAFEFVENKSDEKKSTKSAKSSAKRTTKTSKSKASKAKTDDGFQEMPLDDDLPF